MGAVSRETRALGVEPPASAREFFGERVAKAARFVTLLAGPGRERGLIGPREAPRLWERHILNSAVVHVAIPRGATVADVGSGAGLPGVVLALHRPDLSVTLVEPMLRRSSFLEEVISDLELRNTSVLRARAEELHGELEVDVVTARAVAPLAKLARWTIPLLRAGGTLIALKGSSAVNEVETASKELARLGVASWRVESYGSGVVDPPTRAVVVEMSDDVGGGWDTDVAGNGRSGTEEEQDG